MVTSKADTPLRAVSYCRTSGEPQRDNTSIDRQKADNEKFIQLQGWQFLRHYVDECLSGAKVEGRENFQRMMRDAANGVFDLIVCWDVTRFARDGCDIVESAKHLKTNFGIHVVDSKGQFDTRDHRRTLSNFVQAGVAEDERLRIMERLIGGRIRRAQQGLPWTPKLPAGRGFHRTSKTSGKWYVNEQGDRLKALLTRYADGEPLATLRAEYGFKSIALISRIIHESQLSGTYQACFDCPDISIRNLKVPVPAIPQVITPELEARVRARLVFNRRWNKLGKAKYLLTGFVRCAHCGRALVAGHNRTRMYYRHYTNSLASRDRDCPYAGIPADLLEARVLNYLYSFFLDKPAFDKAVKAGLPSDDDRKTVQRDLKAAERRLAEVNREIENLAVAVAKGADPSLLVNMQGELKAEREALETRSAGLQEKLTAMPDSESVTRQATHLRYRLLQKHTGKDWKKTPYDELRHFLHFLFGDDPGQTGSGIFVYAGTDARGKGFWRITFKGHVQYHEPLIDDRPFRHLVLNRKGQKAKGKPFKDNE